MINKIKLSPFNTSAGIGAFKTIYGPDTQAFKEQQNLMAKSFAKIPVYDEKPSPQGNTMVVTMSGNESGRAMNEYESMDDPESINPVPATVLPREFLSPFMVTGRAIALSESNKQAFGKMLDKQFKDNLNRGLSSLNRQCLGKGTGQMTLANGAGSAATALIVDNAIPFRRGMYLDSFATIGGAKEINHALVTDVNYSTNTLTISPAQTWSDNSVIVTSKVQDAPPTGGKELTGLQAICDTTAYSTTFENIVVANNPEWKGNVYDASAAPISQDILQKSLDQGMIVGGASPNLLISNYPQARSFKNTEIQKTRYEPTKIDAGATTLRWNELEWVREKDYDLDEVGMYDTNEVFRIQVGDLALDDTGGVTYSKVNGKNAITGFLSYYGNMGTWKRNAHIRVTNLLPVSVF